MYDIVVDMQSFYMYCERECLVCCISLIGFCESFGLCIKVVYLYLIRFLNTHLYHPPVVGGLSRSAGVIIGLKCGGGFRVPFSSQRGGR